MEEEIFLHLSDKYPTSVRGVTSPARELTQYFSFLLLFLLLFYSSTWCRAIRAEVLQLWAGSCGGIPFGRVTFAPRVKGTALPKTIGRKKLRTRRAIIYRGGCALFFPLSFLLRHPRSSVPTALWQKFKGRRVIARAARWSIADRAERRAEVGR